jgi:hypothetical protein
MGGAVITKVAKTDVLTSVLNSIGYGHYIVHYTNNTFLVWDDKLQVHKHPEQYMRVEAVDEMDAAVKGMARLKGLYGANNVRFGGDELCHDTVKADGSTD